MAYNIVKSALITAVIVLCSSNVLCSPEEDQLTRDLLIGYNPGTPPNPTWNESVTVSFGLTLIKITRVSEEENSITLMIWLRMLFTDYRLAWNPANYSGIHSLRIPYQRLWLPDIMLYNGLSGSQFFDDKVLAKVKSNGEVYAVPPVLLTASCDMDLAFFPYDTQSCQLMFASWAYDTSVLDLQPMTDNIGTTVYTPNPEWDLVNSSMELHLVFYSCCPGEMYADITATLEIERRNGPYTVKLVIPSVLTAFLILFTFLLPSSSGEKIVFCLHLMLSLILLLVYLHISVPTNSESVLGEFLTFALFLDVFATILAVTFYVVADALLMRDKLGGPESEKHWNIRKRKLKHLRIAEFVFFFLFLIIFIIGTAVILTRRG